MNKFVEDDSIQFEEIKGKIIFFANIPYFSVEKLNQFLKKVNLSLEYKWFESSSLTESNPDIAEDTLQLNKAVNFENHIEDTLAYFKLHQDDNPLYIFLICKPKKVLAADAIDFLYHHMNALYKGILRRNKDSWLIINASVDELPTEAQMKRAKGILIFLII